MNNAYRYSADMYELFSKDTKEPTEDTSSTGLMKPKGTAKQEAPTDSYDPMGFTSGLGSTLRTFFDEEQIKALDSVGLSAQEKRDQTLNQYYAELDMDSLARESANQVNRMQELYGIVDAQGSKGAGITERLQEDNLELTTSPIPTARPEAEEAPVEIDTAAIEAAVIAAMDTSNVEVDTPVEQEAATTGEGLMSQPSDSKDSAIPKTELSRYTDDFAEVYLKEHEGLKSHKSLEGGKDTAALGVKFSLGLKRSDYKSDAEFAGAVALKHRDKAKAKFGKAKWDKLPESVKFAMTDLNYNTGTVGSSGSKKDTTSAMKNTLDFIGMTTKAGDKASLISLAKRRAWNWNKAAADIGESRIAKIKQIPTPNGGTKFEYLDSDGGVVHSTTTSRTPVKLNNSGVATTLTSTREIDM